MSSCNEAWILKPRKFEANKFKANAHISKTPCKTCGSHDSDCECNFKGPMRKTEPLVSDCTLVNSVVCSKMVQKVAETTFPFTSFTPAIPPGTPLSDILSVNVVPNLAGIVNNGRIIRDKVVNIGLIPATISVTIAGIALPSVLTTSLPFQAHTDCPGACPEDTLIETPLEVEGIFTQPGVPIITVAGLVALTGILVKIILRTTITVTRPLIVDANGIVCDVNDRRCAPTTTPIFTFPAPPTGTGGLTT